MTSILAMVTMEHIYNIVGLMLLIFAIGTVADQKNPHRFCTAMFWLLFSCTFFMGNFIDTKAAPEINRPYYIAAGLMVIAMTVIASAGKFSKGDYNEANKEIRLKNRERFGNWLFVPLLIIPVLIVILALFFKVNALIGLGISSVVGFIIIIAMAKPNAVQASNEGRRVLDGIGWALILSQFLAALGFLFNKAGVGTVIAVIVQGIIPENSYFMAVFAYSFGMLIFTMIMGNAFAAFAVITTGIGIPLVINGYGANPAVVGSIAMLAGYCGTLMTPMAANFNIVPAALLEMKNKNGVIKAQVSMAATMFVINVALMYIFGISK